MDENRTYKGAEDIYLRTNREDIRHILSYPPGWALRWGITAVCVAMLIFLIMAWFIRYPDVVQADALIITENPPIHLYARSSGKISQFLARDKELVKRGQMLAMLENPAALEDIDSLSSWLGHLEMDLTIPTLLKAPIPQALQVGDLQLSYAAFQQELHDFRFYASQQAAWTQIASLEEQIKVFRELNLSLDRQELIFIKELEIAKKDLERNQLLQKQGVISDQVLEEKETYYFQYSRKKEDLRSQILSNRLKMEQLKADILRLKQSDSSTSMGKWLEIKELIENLKNEMKAWRQKYLLVAPIEGRLALSRVWSPQQFVQIDDEVASIVPEKGERRIICRAQMPMTNSGKVQTGMRVNLHLDAFPSQEFGVIRASVKGISLLPDQDKYSLEIAMPDTLLSTYNKSIPFAQELKAKAHIITEDRRILIRVFDQFLSLYKNN